MAIYSVNQEILLIRGTTFVTEELSQKEDGHRHSHLFDNEWLEEACRNGLLQAKLPEIFWEDPDDQEIFLWQIKEAVSFLVLDWGKAPAVTDSYFSIVPWSFVSTRIHN